MKKFAFRLLIIGALLIVMGSGMAQFQKLKIKIPKKIPGLDKILKSKPVLTSSISDAVTQVPFLDDYNPELLTPMSLLPPGPNGGFLLVRPGLFVFQAQSFCLAAGKYSPPLGEGYVYAPLKGPWADIIHSMMQRAVSHPEISQRDIQVLVWAILSRTKISKMSRHMQLAASKLLTPKEIFRINGGALGLIPKSLMEKAFENLPPPVRRVLEAEAQLREMLTEAQATYEELERVAVLQGEPPFDERDHKIPSGRWSLNPDGYFIRYFPFGYSRTRIEIYVPESFRIERDNLGRITLIANRLGNRIETSYDDTVEALSIPGEPVLKAYAFHSIRLERYDPDELGEKQRTERTDIGWAFLGIPTGGGCIGLSSDRFSGLKERYEWCERHKEELDNLFEGIKKTSTRRAPQIISQSSMENIMALGHYAIALNKVIGSRGPDRENWAADHVNLVKRAWQSAVSSQASTIKREHASLERDEEIEEFLTHPTGYNNFSGKWFGSKLFYNPYDHSSMSGNIDLTSYSLAVGSGSPGGNGSEFNPSGGSAQPGGSGPQPLKPLGREGCAEKMSNELKKIKQDLQDNINSCYDNQDIWRKGRPGCDMVELLDCLYPNLHPPHGELPVEPLVPPMGCFKTYCENLDNLNADEFFNLWDCIKNSLEKWKSDMEKAYEDYMNCR